jgi:hypothetical protein
MVSGKTGTSVFLILCLGIQAILLLIMTFVPAGLDRRSSWGLALEHSLLFGAVYLLALVGGVSEAALLKNRAAFRGQLVAPLLAAVLSSILGFLMHTR